MTDSTDSRITANHRKSQASHDRFVIRTPVGCESVASDVMTDSCGRRGGGEGTPVWAGLPFAILDGLWPTGFTLYSRLKRSNEQWIDVLEREAHVLTRQSNPQKGGGSAHLDLTDLRRSP
jgi:hypothetical protein